MIYFDELKVDERIESIEKKDIELAEPTLRVPHKQIHLFLKLSFITSSDSKNW